MTCPGCDSHTSDIRRAFENDQPCPTCGLSAAAYELIGVKRSQADDRVKAAADAAIRDLDQWRRRALIAEWRLNTIINAVTDASDPTQVPAWVLETPGDSA